MTILVNQLICLTQNRKKVTFGWVQAKLLRKNTLFTCQILGCQIDTFCVKMTQFDVAWHNDSFSRNDDTIDENDTFFNKNDTIDENDTFFNKNDTIDKNDTFLSFKFCFLNGNKRKVKFQSSTSRKAKN